jgi:hypothetical protein
MKGRLSAELPASHDSVHMRPRDPPQTIRPGFPFGLRKTELYTGVPFELLFIVLMSNKLIDLSTKGETITPRVGMR